MENRSTNLLVIFGILLLGVIFFAGFYFIPWQKINWGKLQLSSPKTVTVVGEAQTREKSQIAIFTAGVSVINDDKEAAVFEVNQKTEGLIKTVKDFGIKSEDIKTQNLNVYQREETYYEEGRQKTRPGQWSVSNSIEIKLRDVDRASNLADLLAKSGATNVWGPNFSLDETGIGQNFLFEEAVKNAREKAQIVATASGSKLGKIISISEGYQPVSVFRALEGGGGGAPVEPGSSTVKKVVTVVFELE